MEPDRQTSWPATPDDGAELGTSVCISGDLAVAGAPNDNDSAGDDISFSGSAYPLSKRRQWRLGHRNQALRASDAEVSARFGTSVCISNGQALVGAPDHDGQGTTGGAIYFFDVGNNLLAAVAETKKLTASDGMVFDAFGGAVGISGDVLLCRSAC